MEGYGRVEEGLREVVSDQGCAEEIGTRSATGLARMAHQRGLINEETARAVEGLSVLRNLAASSATEELSPERAIDYLALVDAVLFSLGKRTPVAVT